MSRLLQTDPHFARAFGRFLGKGSVEENPGPFTPGDLEIKTETTEHTPNIV